MFLCGPGVNDGSEPLNNGDTGMAVRADGSSGSVALRLTYSLIYSYLLQQQSRDK
jgi:hypothetical protein